MKNLTHKITAMLFVFVALALIFSGAVFAANPFLEPWENIPDGEPRVFTDSDSGEERMYVYGSHDTTRDGYCGYDHVVWSASTDELNDWRYDGVAFKIEQLEGLSFVQENGEAKTINDTGNERLFAPDVIYHPQLKTYYMFVFLSHSHHIFVAQSNSPEGPFVDPKYVGQGFDPAVLVDDVKDENGNQRVYLYWSNEQERSAYACELDPITMQKIGDTLHVPVGHSSTVDSNDTMPHRNLDPFYFFEGPSIRKIGDTYVLSYAKTDASEGNGKLAEIGYAYSDNPFGDPNLGTAWQYGGVLVDNLGEVVQNPYSSGTTTTYKGGNNHGGMIEVNGQWYQIYHRATGIALCRQAMVEPIYPRFEDGKLIIEQAEITSQGFETDGLNPYQKQYALSACYGIGNYIFNLNPSFDFDPESEREDWYPVSVSGNQSWLGYKYFNFGDGIEDDEQLYLTLSLKEHAVGTINVYVSDAKKTYTDSEQPKIRIGSADIDATESLRDVTIPIMSLSGKKAIYLEFLSASPTALICELNTFVFSAQKAVYADNLRVDGNELTGFDPYTFEYSVYLPSLDNIPDVSADAADSLALTIKQATAQEPIATVTVSSESKSNVYKIKFERLNSWDFTATDKDTLLSQWEIISPSSDADSWSIDENGLHMSVLGGDLYSARNTAENIFTLSIPGNWIIETKVSFNKKLTEANQQASLLVYQDADNYLKLNYEFGTYSMGDRTDKTYVQFAHESAKKMTKVSQNPEDVTEIYYRLKKIDNLYTAYYSVDGENYIDAGSAEVSYLSSKVALVAFNRGEYKDDLVATFEYLNYQALPATSQCTCSLYNLKAPKSMELKIPKDHSFTLSSTVSGRGGCQVEGHAHSRPNVTYTLVYDNTAQASVDGNVLTVNNQGEVTVRVTSEWNDADPVYRDIKITVVRDVPDIYGIIFIAGAAVLVAAIAVVVFVVVKRKKK